MPTTLTRALRASAACLALAALGACADPDAEPSATTDPAPTTSSAKVLRGSGEVTLEPGGTVELRLESNPSTGYTWNQTAGDPAIASVSEGDFTADEAPENFPGAAGTSSFVITALAPGRTDVVLGYSRAWEDAPALEEVVVSVTVDD